MRRGVQKAHAPGLSDLWRRIPVRNIEEFRLQNQRCNLGERITRKSYRPGGCDMELIWFILIGLAAGWLACQLMGRGGFGAVGDIIVGVIGSLLGGFLFRTLGVYPGSGLLGSLIIATIGSVILLFLLRLIKKA